MRQHYIVVNEITITDRTMDRIQGQQSGENREEIAPTTLKSPSADDAA